MVRSLVRPITRTHSATALAFCAAELKFLYPGIVGLVSGHLRKASAGGEQPQLAGDWH